MTTNTPAPADLVEAVAVALAPPHVTRMGPYLHMAERAIAAYQAHMASVGKDGGWIVGNAWRTKWRMWECCGPIWTTDRDKATRYARRCDAEEVHREDEDAWSVEPYASSQPDPRDAEIAQLREAIINTPETADFMAGVPLEAAHQRERWGSDHDAGKTAFDWFWLVGYLAQKAADAAVRGDIDKAKHHTISTAAALANWHAALSGANQRMRPGVSAEIQAAAEGRGKLTEALQATTAIAALAKEGNHG